MRVLWWIGNVAWLLGVIPLLVLLLYRLLRPIEEIRRYVADIREHGDALADELAVAPALGATSRHVGRFAEGMTHYAATLEREE